jgi:6-phosphogluconolactonase (cycloisomerase 2 family)
MPVRTSRKASVTPQDITTATCGSLQFAATGYYSNGTTQDQSSNVTWSSSNTSVASINNTGLANGLALGFTNIGATLAGVNATVAQLEVDQLNKITVNPNPANIGSGQSQAFTATGNFTLAGGGTVNQDISSQVTWGSSDTTIATIDQTGNATSTGKQGTTTISATSCDGITVGNATLTVGAPVAVSLQLTPSASTVAAGTTVQFTAVRLLSDGSTQPTQNPVTWSSDTTTVAAIGANSGLAQALAVGSANITATEATTGYTGTTTLTVQAAAARFAYIGNISGGASNSGSISSYTVNPTSTSAPLTPLTETSASSPEQVLLHPSGDLLFYIDSGGAIHSDFVDSTSGALTPTPQVPAVATNPGGGGDFYQGVIDPTGRFIYVTSNGIAGVNGNGVLYGFSIKHTQPSQAPGDAALTAIAGLSGYTDANMVNPTWIMTDRAGQYLYIVNGGNNTISEYSINQTNGQLTPLGTPTIATGGSPLFATTDVNGHVYVANESGPSVSAYSITGGSGSNAGQLTLIGETPIASATDTINVITSPNGNYLYIVDNGSGGAGQVFAYGLNPATGALSSPIGTAQPTGTGPTGIAIDPTGVLLAIDSNDGNISTYTVGSNGGVTPTTTPEVATGANDEFVVFYTAASGQ